MCALSNTSIVWRLMQVNTVGWLVHIIPPPLMLITNTDLFATWGSQRPKGFSMQVGKEKLLWMYEKMVQIRYYEETMAAVYMEGKLPPHIQKAWPLTLVRVLCLVRCTWPRDKSQLGSAYAPTCPMKIRWWAPIAHTTLPSPKACHSTP